MERRNSHRSQKTESNRRNRREATVPGPSPHRDLSRQGTSLDGNGRSGNRTAPSSPGSRRRVQLAARSHSTGRQPHPSDEEARLSSPSRPRQNNRQASQDLQERQLRVYQKALKEQIVQSDHLIKAIYRFSDCIDMTEKAMRNLHDVMGDYWDDDWPGAEDYYVTLQDQEELWDRYEQAMRKLLDPIREYEGQFEGAEDKIEEYQEVRQQYSQACSSLEQLRRRRAAGHDITVAESARARLGRRSEQLVSSLGRRLPKIIASRIPFMEKLFYQLSNNLLQFCLETCKVQSKSCQILSKLRRYDLPVTLGEGRSRTVLRAPARGAAGAPVPSPAR